MISIEYSENSIAEVAHQLIREAPGKIWAIEGEMGAGKTTLIKALVAALGSVDKAGSPTFGIVHEYADPKGEVLAYHFDFYRLENPEEVLDIGFEEYLNSGAWIFMEWPDRIAGYLPEDCWRLKIDVQDETTRIIHAHTE